MAGKSNPIINRIADPAPSILQHMENINGQVNLVTRNIIGEPQLGTTTATKRNSSTKIFVIGVIPPASPVNFIPIEPIIAAADLRAGPGVLETVGGSAARGEGIAEAQQSAARAGITLNEQERSEEEIARSQQTKSIMIYKGATRLEAEDPNTVRLKKNIRAADGYRREIAKRQTDALRAQIKALNDIPPLVMVVNPRNFSRNYEQSVDSGSKGRFGHIVHSWLEQPMKISTSGVSAGQYVLDGAGGGGLTAERRVHTLSYHNLMSLLLTYKNNGVIFAGPEVGAERGIPILSFALYIYYDNHIYIGSFDDFAIDDKADKPFNLEYSFKFNVRYDMDIDSSHLVESSIFAIDTAEESFAAKILQ